MARFILFVLPVVLFVLGCSQHESETVTPTAKPDIPQRVISTLPSITEVLFDIGLGDKIVGDSFFTKYPPETKNIEKIGGLFDTNREKIVSLKPDLVILSTENTTLRQSLSVPCLAVDHRTLQGVIDSYPIIGAAFGESVLETAKQKQKELIGKLDGFAKKTRKHPPIKILICIDRSRGTGKIQNLFVAGKDSFLSEAVKLAGGENIAEVIGLLAPTLSAEGVIDLAPDVIIDVCAGSAGKQAGAEDWNSLGDKIPAVRNRRVYLLDEDYATIPGARTPLLIEKIERIINQ